MIKRETPEPPQPRDRVVALTAIKLLQQLTGYNQVLCRPLLANLPERPPGATLEACDGCGRFCWRMANEPPELPEGVIARCTACGLRAVVK